MLMERGNSLHVGTEEEVLVRFQALQAGSGYRGGDRPELRGRWALDTQISASVMSSAATPDKDMLLADYALNWLETFKRGKIRPSSYERYQFCLQLRV